jgi:hypothetical protein
MKPVNNMTKVLFAQTAVVQGFVLSEEPCRQKVLGSLGSLQAKSWSIVKTLLEVCLDLEMCRSTGMRNRRLAGIHYH